MSGNQAADQRFTFQDSDLDRTALTIGAIDADETCEYWRSRTPLERLAALEFLRQIAYGYDPVADRLQRLLEVVELSRR